jgi:hypothetical protein
VGVKSPARATQTNRISTHVQAYIEASQIEANSVTLSAEDSSTIKAVAGAASLTGGFGGVGVAVSIGVALAKNEISNQVEAYIANADGDSSALDYGVTTTSDFTSSATAASLQPGDRVRLAEDYGDPDFNTLSSGTLGTKNVALSHGQFVQLVEDYTTEPLPDEMDSPVAIRHGDFVRVASGYVGGNGLVGSIYKYIGPTRGRRYDDLNSQDYAPTRRTQLVGGEAGAVYSYVGAAGVDLGAGLRRHLVLEKGHPGSRRQHLPVHRGRCNARPQFPELRRRPGLAAGDARRHRDRGGQQLDHRSRVNGGKRRGRRGLPRRGGERRGRRVDQRHPQQDARLRAEQ